jgi:L-ascorbate metabolism protein UlaG (beta-lactamase superfamily)
MQIKWLGHASFLITSQSGQKIITDPYSVGGGLNLTPINESAHIVTQSHNHGDHNNVKTIRGNPAILNEAGKCTIKNIEFKAIPAYHDEARGDQRGNNLLFCFIVDEMNLCHLGDLGHPLSSQQLSQIGPVDILFIPVGGYFTIDAKTATAVVESIRPRIVFPMHYKTEKVNYPISGVDEFLKYQKNIRKINSSEYEIKKTNLPEKTEIIVLLPAN